MNIFINYICVSDQYWQISKLNLDLSVVKTVYTGYNTPFLSTNDAHVYVFQYNHFSTDYKVNIYNHDLVLQKEVGQTNNPTGTFYFPTGIKQFECNKGRYYWLNNTNLQVLKEDTGKLVKSVKIAADNFTIDSSVIVVLIKNAAKEVNHFT